MTCKTTPLHGDPHAFCVWTTPERHPDFAAFRERFSTGFTQFLHERRQAALVSVLAELEGSPSLDADLCVYTWITPAFLQAITRKLDTVPVRERDAAVVAFGARALRSELTARGE